MLEVNARNAFDNFGWCPKETQVIFMNLIYLLILCPTIRPDEMANVYAVTIFDDTGILCVPKDNRATFRDYSNEVSSGSTHKKNPTKPIALPNPTYLTLHAAIAEILHASGAGSFFDAILDRFTGKDGEGRALPVPSWPELEKWMAGE